MVLIWGNKYLKILAQVSELESFFLELSSIRRWEHKTLKRNFTLGFYIRCMWILLDLWKVVGTAYEFLVTIDQRFRES